MTDEEKWEIWRNKNAEIKKPYGGSVHKHIVWYEGADRRKAFLDGLAEGRKEKEELIGMFINVDLEKENAELKEKYESNKKSISLIIKKANEERAEEYIRTDGTNGEKMWEKIHKEFPNCIVVKTAKSKERLTELLLEYTKAVYLDGLAEGRKESANDIDVLTKENAELKAKISTLLSCSNCPDNKGGYICEKEYNDKCLAQKIICFGQEPQETVKNGS